ncbi:MAG TPA: TraR/DksA C4-type zinc finger protein [Pyrinomonadaceae bacterium]|nr:TraR/DksA C4-type zinc finger protein [Pyrinomonadaceae bacterium]
MSDNHTIQLVEIPIGGKGGAVWNRLHGEREEICETLVGISGPNFDVTRELLQARLRKVDDALDRLMSGSYGMCSQCSQPINEMKLDIDPATSLCLDCSGSKPDSDISNSETSATIDVLLLESLDSYDTILLRTHNSEYRILLLEPKTGRALVEGGSYLLEPSEALIKGSALSGSAFDGGAISIGGRLEMWVNERVMLTSPIKSFEVKHNATAESAESIFVALH